MDIISIGTLGRNLLWKEQTRVRTPHATCSLIRAGKKHILVDPGLPAQVMAARLNERTGLSPAVIDTVFLTNFRPAHRFGLAAFEKATVLMHAPEREYAKAHLEELLALAERAGDETRSIELDLAVLQRTREPDDRLADGVDLFPLPGYTPGTCGLLVTSATLATLVAGDAVPTAEHLLAGQLLPETVDRETATESLREVYEVADLIVPGHDNIFVSPRQVGG